MTLDICKITVIFNAQKLQLQKFKISRKKKQKQEKPSSDRCTRKGGLPKMNALHCEEGRHGLFSEAWAIRGWREGFLILHQDEWARRMGGRWVLGQVGRLVSGLLALLLFKKISKCLSAHCSSISRAAAHKCAKRHPSTKGTRARARPGGGARGGRAFVFAAECFWIRIFCEKAKDRPANGLPPPNHPPDEIGGK